MKVEDNEMLMSHSSSLSYGNNRTQEEEVDKFSSSLFLNASTNQTRKGRDDDKLELVVIFR
jgi:hypothetical protein